MDSQTSKDLPKDTLFFPEKDRKFLEPHLPNKDAKSDKTFTTLTFATSLDSQLALSPGAPTQLSGPQSKAMTHYLRFRHDATLIGIGTAVADNPSLNCRLEGAGGYGGEGSKIFVLSKEGRGKAPYIITGVGHPPSEKTQLLEEYGGKFITLGISKSDIGDHKLDWAQFLQTLCDEGLKSLMIEGGGKVINSLLEPAFQPLIDSVIVTIAPTWLGEGGVVVSPPRRVDEKEKPIAAASGIRSEKMWFCVDASSCD